MRSSSSWRGHYTSDEEKSETIACTFSRKGGKMLKRNGKGVRAAGRPRGVIPVVIVSPADASLISDAADERRRYLNGFISQLDRSYLQAVIRYNAVLGERNKLLKISSDEDMLLIYDRQLTEHARTIHRLRREYVERLQPLAAEFYRTLSDDREQVTLDYRSELNDAPLEEILLRNRQRDLVNQFTASGVHRDDLILKIGGYPLRKYGSQGQQKSFLIALKLAQYAVVAEQKGGAAAAAARRSVRQAGCRPRHAAAASGSWTGVRPDRHHGLQPHPPAHHPRQGLRALPTLHGRRRDRNPMRRTKTLLMGDLLKEFFSRPYIAAKVAEGKLPDTWREIVGERAAAETVELKLENRVLYVRIRSSILRSELFYQREALRREINERSGVKFVNVVIIR